MLTLLLGPPPPEPPAVWVAARLFPAVPTRRRVRSGWTPLVGFAVATFFTGFAPRFVSVLPPAVCGAGAVLGGLLFVAAIERDRVLRSRRVASYLRRGVARGRTLSHRRPRHWEDAWFAAFLWTPWLSAATFLSVAAPAWCMWSLSASVPYSEPVTRVLAGLCVFQVFFCVFALPVVLTACRHRLRRAARSEPSATAPPRRSVGLPQPT